MPEGSTLSWYVVPVIIALAVFILGIFIEVGARKNSSILHLGEVLKSGSFLDSTVLSITIGFLLLSSGVQNYLFSPGLGLEDTIPHMVFRYGQIVIGTMLIVGTFTRLATIGIIALYIGGFFFFPVLKMLDYTVFMGIGVFLFLIHRDVLSFTFFFHKLDKKRLLDKYRKYALPILRFVTGASLVIVAIHHHIINPSPAVAFIEERPLLNVIQSLFGVTDYSHELLIFNVGILGILVGAFLTFAILERFVSVIICIGLILMVLIGGLSFLPIAVPYFAIAYIIITGNQFEEREIKEKG